MGSSRPCRSIQTSDRRALGAAGTYTSDPSREIAKSAAPVDAVMMWSTTVIGSPTTARRARSNRTARSDPEAEYQVSALEVFRMARAANHGLPMPTLQVENGYLIVVPLSGRGTREEHPLTVRQHGREDARARPTCPIGSGQQPWIPTARWHTEKPRARGEDNRAVQSPNWRRARSKGSCKARSPRHRR